MRPTQQRKHELCSGDFDEVVDIQLHRKEPRLLIFKVDELSSRMTKTFLLQKDRVYTLKPHGDKFKLIGKRNGTLLAESVFGKWQQPGSSDAQPHLLSEIEAANHDARYDYLFIMKVTVMQSLLCQLSSLAEWQNVYIRHLGREFHARQSVCRQQPADFSGLKVCIKNSHTYLHTFPLLSVPTVTRTVCSAGTMAQIDYVSTRLCRLATSTCAPHFISKVSTVG